MTIVAAAVLEPGAGPKVTLHDLRAHMASRLPGIPAFRQRVVNVPFGIHHPVLVDDPAFNLAAHVHLAHGPAPAERDRLEQLCASLTDTQLDRRRPLWQMYLVNGLAGGRQAIVLSVHHCLMDGYATVNAVSRLFSPSPNGRSVSDRWVPEKMPSGLRLLFDALDDHRRSLARLPELVRKTRRKSLAARAYERQSTAAVPKPGTDTPWCSLHGTRTSRRSLACLDLPLADLRLVKDAAGATVNDVLLAVAGTALQRYLHSEDGVPARPLISLVPVGLDRPGASSRTGGNRLAGMPVSLATDIEDPWQRLQAVAASSAEAKYRLGLEGPELMSEWAELFPPFAAHVAVRLALKTSRDHPEKIQFNAVISSVRGPEHPLRFGPAAIEDLYMAGPMTVGVGIDVMAWDYGARLFACITSYNDAVSRPAGLAEGMRTALRELVVIAGHERLDHPVVAIA